MTAHDDRFEDVCKPIFAGISVQLLYIRKLLEGTNGEPGMRMEMDRLKIVQRARAAHDVELAAMRGRIISGVIIAILLALGGAVASAVMQFQTYEMVRAVNEQGRVAPVIVAAPQPAGSTP